MTQKKAAKPRASRAKKTTAAATETPAERTAETEQETSEKKVIVVSTDAELKAALDRVPDLDEMTKTYIRAHHDLPEELGVREARDEVQLERVRRARGYISIHIPFLGYLVLQLALRMSRVVDRVPTAAITGTGTVYFNSRFLCSLTDEEIRGLVCHEVMHAALECLGRRGARDPHQWNRAHDYAINDMITDFMAGKKVSLPPGGLLDAAYKGMAAEEIYPLLMAQAEEQAKKKGQKGKGKKGKGSGEGDGSSDGDGDGEGDSYGEGGSTGDPSKGKRGELGADMREDLDTTEEGRRAARGDENARNRISHSWREKLMAAEMQHNADKSKGSIPGGLMKILNEIRNPLVPWKELLSRWMGENGRKLDVTYRKRSRRSEAVSADVVLPGQKRTGFPEVTILWDTSGSMNGTETEILAEVAEIVEGLGLRVRLIVCDCAIHADVEGLEDVRTIFDVISGGGGSSFTPAFQKLAEEGNTSVVVAFTDGYIDVPSMQPPDLNGVLWVITEGGVRPAPWGEALRIDSKGYGVME